MSKYEKHFLKVICLWILFLSVFPITSAYAVTVGFEWDPNSCPPQGYELYARLEGKSYDYSQPVYRGEESFCSIELEEDGIKRYFVVRAFVGTEFSDNSNEISYTPQLEGNTPSNNFDQDVDAGSGNGDLTAQWPNSDEAVELDPVLILDYDNLTLPHTILWQVSTEIDMTPLVLSITTSSDSLSFKVPKLVFDTDTQYYWQAKFYNVNGELINTSDIASFITVESQLSNDKDSDGIPDHQKIEEESDLDGDGVADMMQHDLMCVKTAKGDARICIKCLSPGALPVAITALDDTDFSYTLNRPDVMTYGLISFKLFLDAEVESTDVGVFFSEPAPVDTAWYKYDRNDGWTLFKSAVFSEDRRSVTFTLADGDFGDEDGIRNGIIVDPSGLGAIAPKPGTSTHPYPSTDNSSCYINSLTAEDKANSTTAACGLLILLIVVFSGSVVRLFGGRE